MADLFQVRMWVRVYELDTQGHVNGAVYMQYGEQARWECLSAAGVTQDKLLAAGIGPVRLKESIRYHRELRGGDEVDVSCTFVWGTGKTFRLEQEFRRDDGTLAADLTSVGGLLDLEKRRLVPDPGAHLRSLATAPALLHL